MLTNKTCDGWYIIHIELMKRLTYLIDGEMILKYQLVAEELDALVSVKCDEDLAHMFEEMEHYPRMRTFLFPINHVIMMENPIQQLPLDQRYIFSINGIIFPKHHPTSSMTTKHHVGLRSVASSACTSPRSPDSSAAEFVLNSDNPWLHTTNMPKIHSSPSICNVPQQSNQYSYPQYYHNSTTQAAYHAHSSYNSPNLQPFDTHNQRSDRVVSMRSGGRADGARFQPDSAPPSYNYASSRDQNRGGSGYCSHCMHHDNCAHFLDRRSIDRQGTLPWLCLHTRHLGKGDFDCKWDRGHQNRMFYIYSMKKELRKLFFSYFTIICCLEWCDFIHMYIYIYGADPVLKVYRY